MGGEGDNKKLDSLMSDFHDDEDDEEAPDANVYDAGMNFGDAKLYTMGLAEGANNGDFSKADMLCSTVAMLLESIADWIDCNAQLEKVPRVFITGSVSSHPVARNLLTKYLDGKMWTRGRG